MKVYKIYSDPGHGWVAVKRAELVELGIIDKVSSYSYQRGKTVYLEEDVDLCLFFNAYRDKYGKDPAFKEVHSDNRSPIRSYDSFKNNRIKLSELAGVMGIHFVKIGV